MISIRQIVPAGVITESAVDPVCDMSVDPERAEYRSFESGRPYYFCSAGCKAAFDGDPAKYLHTPETEPAG